jgi:hypothetical protein
LKILSDGKNLKGGDKPLTYFIEVDTNDTEKYEYVDGENNQKELNKKIKKRLYFTEQQVKDFNIESIGTSIPLQHGKYYVMMNYFNRWWGHFLGWEGKSLYLDLLQFGQGERKDWCYPSNKMLSFMNGNKDPKTVRKYIGVLEEYGFVKVFHCLGEDESEQKKGNTQESNIYKIRSTIPVLPLELVEKLPPKLKERHEKDLLEFNQWSINNLPYMNLGEKEFKEMELYEQSISVATSSKRRNAMIAKMKETGKIVDESKSLFEERHLKFWVSFCVYLVDERILSKPSCDMWFKTSLGEMHKSGDRYFLHIFSANDYVRNTLRNSYDKDIKIYISEYFDVIWKTQIETDKINITYRLLDEKHIEKGMD